MANGGSQSSVSTGTSLLPETTIPSGPIPSNAPTWGGDNTAWTAQFEGVNSLTTSSDGRGFDVSGKVVINSQQAIAAARATQTGAQGPAVVAATAAATGTGQGGNQVPTCGRNRDGTPIDTANMNPEILARINAMWEAAPASARQNACITSGYRSDALQEKIWRSGVRPAARPRSMGGIGSRHTGRAGGAFDFRDPSGWFHRNASQYGLAYPVPGDYGHFQLDPSYRGALFANGSNVGGGGAAATITSAHEAAKVLGPHGQVAKAVGFGGAQRNLSIASAARQTFDAGLGHKPVNWLAQNGPGQAGWMAFLSSYVGKISNGYLSPIEHYMAWLNAWFKPFLAIGSSTFKAGAGFNQLTSGTDILQQLMGGGNLTHILDSFLGGNGLGNRGGGNTGGSGNLEDNEETPGAWQIEESDNDAASALITIPTRSGRLADAHGLRNGLGVSVGDYLNQAESFTEIVDALIHTGLLDPDSVKKDYLQQSLEGMDYD